MAIFSRPQGSARADGSGRRAEAAGLTIIAVGATVTGDVASEGVVKVEGTVEGTVRAGTQLLVAAGAVIRGDVFAAEVVAGGQIHGTIQAADRVEIQAGALVVGDIRTHRLHIADGGRINGQISMELEAGDRGLQSSHEFRGELSKVE
jgi:cytoskeletal protein CcmA (bactofilin family)